MVDGKELNIQSWDVEYPLVLYNTELRQKQPVAPLDGQKIKMYTCGPTVYDYAHIGNFRCYVFEDILRRTIKFFGFPIEQVMNLTDVDDKTIRGANKENISLLEYTDRYKKAFFHDAETLGIEKVEHYPAATDYIPQMIHFIEELIDKGFAYQGKDGSVYFPIAKFSRYGCLSHLKLDELETGASERIASDEYDKDCAADFVLWKGWDEQRDGKIYWESPFGPGRPGWHLECSCMATEILGEQVDIHCGGVDNIFPHHENEIAQSEALTGKRFVGLWCHSEHLLVENKKMSKSLGNFYTLRDLLDKGYSGLQVRYLLLSGHYRTQLNFTMEGLEAARSSLCRVQDCIQRLYEVDFEGLADSAVVIVKQTFSRFCQALADDLNVSASLAAVFDLVRECNTLIDEKKMKSGDALLVLDLLARINQVLGVFSLEKKELEVPQEILDALQQREEARKSKDWARADQLRDHITGLGYVIEDTANGLPKVSLRDG